MSLFCSLCTETFKVKQRCGMQSSKSKRGGMKSSKSNKGVEWKVQSQTKGWNEKFKVKKGVEWKVQIQTKVWNENFNVKRYGSESKSNRKLHNYIDSRSQEIFLHKAAGYFNVTCSTFTKAGNISPWSLFKLSLASFQQEGSSYEGYKKIWNNIEG